MTGHRNRSYVVTGAASGTGRATTSYLRAVNFFGAVATLNGLLPLLSRSPAPRAVAISSIAALNAAKKEIVEACLRMDEAAAHGVATAAFTAGALATADRSPIPEATRAAVVLYASAKLALERWCRESALAPPWAGRGIPLNAVALGVFDTPAAANLLEHAETRAALRRLMPLASAYMPIVRSLARARMRRKSGAALESFEALQRHPAFERTMRVLTLVWGAGLLLESGTCCALVFMLPAAAFLVVSPLLGSAAFVALTAWSFWYARRKLHRAGRTPGGTGGDSPASGALPEDAQDEIPGSRRPPIGRADLAPPPESKPNPFSSWA